MRRNNYILIILGILLISVFSEFAIAANTSEGIEVDLFWMNGCSACAQMKPFLEDMQSEYTFKLNSYETSTNKDLFLERFEQYNVPKDRRGYVPAVFIKDSYFIGYSAEIRVAIESILKGEEIDSRDNLIGETVKTEILGFWDVEFSLEDRSILGVGILLALLDSINVCSITVLVFLIVFSLSVGSLKRAFKIGIVFTIVIFLFYASFMLLLTGILGFFVTQYGNHIRISMILISLFAGVLLIKDFFWYGKGLSLRIPTSAKPLLEKYMKQATLGSTIILGLLASLVELPCTAIFPLIYTSLLAESGVYGLSRIAYILIYNLIYIWPLLFITFATYFSWTKIENVDKTIQKYKKAMKLIAGVALFAIAIYFALPFILQ